MAKLLALAATVDNRIVTREMVGGWMAAIGDLDFEASVRALHEHRRSSTEYLQPAHIAAIVRDAEWAARALPALDEERRALAEFVAYTGLARDVVAAHWSDAGWREARLGEARRAHRAQALGGAA